VQQSLSATLPPVRLTPNVDVAQQILRNGNWYGSPIILSRDENPPASHNFWEHQLPYAAPQLTGGRGELSVRGLGLMPFSEVHCAHRSVDQVCEQLDALEGERPLVQLQGRVFGQELDL